MHRLRRRRGVHGVQLRRFQVLQLLWMVWERGFARKGLNQTIPLQKLVELHVYTDYSILVAYTWFRRALKHVNKALAWLLN